MLYFSRHINSITKEENESGEDPALKSLSLVFKSLLGSSSSESKPSTSTAATASDSSSFPMDILSMFQGISPIVLPTGGDEVNLQDQLAAHFGPSSKKTVEKNENIFSPFKVLKLLEPHLTEQLVNEIQTVYEFHIKNEKENENLEIFHLDLKSAPKGQIGIGPSIFSKTDCVIKLSDEDLKDLLSDKLKPFTAYMSGRIEIQGDLQDVFKLKRLIKNLTCDLNLKKI